ncbi:UV DNA damage repair endonuclease UvsE [Bacillus sp. 2205SS5-2]|uniref:UV DNA damage repair endonuclease UvsE n=1 Tax=Bacillus sp. 2205SS5-2 TaxID=3109031 RepID=UPI00300695A0
MTVIRLGYVAMSVHLQNASPSQTMTYKQFSGLKDREAAIEKLERIATSNLRNCLRLLKHCVANEIEFFRFSSKLIPLANHPELEEWKYMRNLKEPLDEIAQFLSENPMRVDFHPDHFVLLNSEKVDILKNSLRQLKLHEQLLKRMKIDPIHRCVLHVGGAYDDKEKALEQFIANWGFVPPAIQQMIILENDDTVFSMTDALYLCEKLGIPHVFDYHHHLAYHDEPWEPHWERVVASWDHSPLPLKMHISSPRSDKEFRAHADYIDVDMFLTFLKQVAGSVDQVDCMIEAKKKDDALFRLVKELKEKNLFTWLSDSSFTV